MNCVNCDICLYHHELFVFFSKVFLSSRVTGACPVTTDVIMRINVRTATTTTTTTTTTTAVLKFRRYACCHNQIRQAFTHSAVGQYRVKKCMRNIPVLNGVRLWQGAGMHATSTSYWNGVMLLDVVSSDDTWYS